MVVAFKPGDLVVLQSVQNRRFEFVVQARWVAEFLEDPSTTAYQSPVIDYASARAKWYAGRHPASGESGQFYATAIRDDGRVAYLAGPYPTHREALDILPTAQGLVYKHFPSESPWLKYGTASLPLGIDGPKSVFKEQLCEPA
jgi:hypothetical protein